MRPTIKKLKGVKDLHVVSLFGTEFLFVGEKLIAATAVDGDGAWKATMVNSTIPHRERDRAIRVYREVAINLGLYRKEIVSLRGDLTEMFEDLQLISTKLGDR